MNDEALGRFIEAARERFGRTWHGSGDLLPAIERSQRSIEQSRKLLDRLASSSTPSHQ
jgi:hypothetical protein